MKISKSKIKPNSVAQHSVAQHCVAQYSDDDGFNTTSLFSAGFTSLLMFSSFTTPALPAQVKTPYDEQLSVVSTDKFKQLKTTGVQSSSSGVGYAKDALALQSEFGLNVVQLATLLGVERKTIYNWKKSPKTQLQERNMLQIEALKTLASVIDKKHGPFFGKLLFGKHADRVFFDEFTRSLQSADALEATYDKFYTHIDGFVKRKLREQRSRKV